MSGKHEKKIQMEWNEKAAESYTAAEIKKLRSENKELQERVASLEKAFSKLKALAREEIVANNKTIASKDRTIEKLERKILSLVNDYV